MKGFEKKTSDGQYWVEVDLRDKGLAVDEVDITLTSVEEYGENTEILISRKNLIELLGISSEALDYIGYPLKGFTNE